MTTAETMVQTESKGIRLGSIVQMFGSLHDSTFEVMGLTVDGRHILDKVSLNVKYGCYVRHREPFIQNDITRKFIVRRL